MDAIDERQGSYEISDIEDVRTGPGILVLSSKSSSKFMNRRAWQLIQEINQSQSVETGGLLPPLIMQMYAEVRKVLAQQKRDHFEQFEIRKIAGDPKRPVLLRGFAFLGGQNGHPSLVLILLESIRYREQPTTQVKDRFHLTTREHHVVEHLLKGWTNKEIGSAMGISEQTVKSHISRIMTKIGATTRSDILLKVLASEADRKDAPQKAFLRAMNPRGSSDSRERFVETTGWR
jgi:DNA-binding CsgD family transcriptional regulator